MNETKKNSVNLGMIVGILGFLAGIGLMSMGNWFIGIFGSIASAGLGYIGYRDLKRQ